MSSQPAPSGPPKDLPRDQTVLSQHRNLMASERTYSAWVRTVLSLIAVALALPKLITDMRFVPVVKVIGIIFIGTAIILFVTSSLNYADTGKRLRAAGIITTPMWLYWLMVCGPLLSFVLSFLLLF